MRVRRILKPGTWRRSCVCVCVCIHHRICGRHLCACNICMRVHGARRPWWYGSGVRCDTVRCVGGRRARERSIQNTRTTLTFVSVCAATYVAKWYAIVWGVWVFYAQQWVHTHYKHTPVSVCVRACVSSRSSCRDRHSMPTAHTRSTHMHTHTWDTRYGEHASTDVIKANGAHWSYYWFMSYVGVRVIYWDGFSTMHYVIVYWISLESSEARS